MNKDKEIYAEITALLNYMLRSLGAKDMLKFLHRNTYIVDKYLKLKAKFKRKNQQCFKLYERNVELEKQFKKALDEIEYQIIELFLGVENKDRTYCEKILDIINKVKEQ